MGGFLCSGKNTCKFQIVILHCYSLECSYTIRIYLHSQTLKLLPYLTILLEDLRLLYTQRVIQCLHETYHHNQEDFSIVLWREKCAMYAVGNLHTHGGGRWGAFVYRREPELLHVWGFWLNFNAKNRSTYNKKRMYYISGSYFSNAPASIYQI